MKPLTQSFVVLTGALAMMLGTSSVTNADDDKGVNWKQIHQTSGSGGGKSKFTVSANARIKIELECNAKQQGNTTFRINLSKRNDRTGNYQILGTIFKATVSSNKTLKAKLMKGHYQLYVSVKNMSYNIKVFADR